MFADQVQPKEAEKEFPTWKKTRTFLSGIECQRWAGQSLEMISHLLLAILGHLVFRTDKLGQFVDFEKCLSVPTCGWRSPVDFHNDQIMKGQARGQGSVLDHVYKAARP